MSSCFTLLMTDTMARGVCDTANAAVPPSSVEHHPNATPAKRCGAMAASPASGSVATHAPATKEQRRQIRHAEGMMRSRTSSTASMSSVDEDECDVVFKQHQREMQAEVFEISQLVGAAIANGAVMTSSPEKIMNTLTHLKIRAERFGGWADVLRTGYVPDVGAFQRHQDYLPAPTSAAAVAGNDSILSLALLAMTKATVCKGRGSTAFETAKVALQFLYLEAEKHFGHLDGFESIEEKLLQCALWWEDPDMVEFFVRHASATTAAPASEESSSWPEEFIARIGYSVLQSCNARCSVPFLIHLKKRFNPTCTILDKHGMSLLHHTVVKGDFPLSYGCCGNYFDTGSTSSLKFLTSVALPGGGAKEWSIVDAEKNGWTPLLMAIHEGDRKTVEHLLNVSRAFFGEESKDEEGESSTAHMLCPAKQQHSHGVEIHRHAPKTKLTFTSAMVETVSPAPCNPMGAAAGMQDLILAESFARWDDEVLV